MELKETEMKDLRVGCGYDIHRLEDGFELWLGGIRIDHSKGAVAHSDGDALIHAICDALLGSLALGDIGQHFPDTSERFRGIDSKVLLAECVDMVEKKGYCIGNVDAMLMLERPKIKDYIPEMRSTLAGIMKIDAERVSVKATTKEKLDAVGQELGVEASAVVLVFKK